MQHWYTSQALGEIALYTAQDIAKFWRRLEREWRPQALLRPIQHTRIEIRYTRARLLLALAIQQPSPKWLHRARAEAKAIIAERMPWSLAHGRLMLACAASIDRSSDPARLFSEVEGLYDALDMSLHAAVARARQGQVLAGSVGKTLEAEGNAMIAGLGVVRPAAFVRILAPALTPHC